MSTKYTRKRNAASRKDESYRSAIPQLWAPWRIGYVQQKKVSGCIFCHKPRQRRDAENYIVQRRHTAYSLLNIYPYNNGHVMVAPNRHVAELEALTAAEQEDIGILVRETIVRLKQLVQAQGFNVGLNLGNVAGAGYDQHLHVHIVPRWQGDTNFMPVVAKTKVIPQSLRSLYRALKHAQSPAVAARRSARD